MQFSHAISFVSSAPRSLRFLLAAFFILQIGAIESSADNFSRLSRSASSFVCDNAFGRQDKPDIDLWISDLTASYTKIHSTRSLPTSFEENSFLLRLRNDFGLKRLINEWRSASVEAALGANSRINPKKEFSLRNSIDRLGRSFLGWLTRGALISIFVKSTHFRKNSLDLQNVTKVLGHIRNFHSEFKADVDRYKTLFGPELFTFETLSRGAINTQTMKLFAFVNDEGSTVPSRDAANAIALLHPITDEALDKRMVSKASVEKLTKYLNDFAPPQIESSYELILFGLLEFIQKDFPPKQHPQLYEMLSRLHHAQLRSLRQQSQISEAELIAITFEKGGLSTAIAGYLALGGLNLPQYEFFFKAGAIFQIMDDFLDIKNDLLEGGTTLWTQKIVSGQSLSPTLIKFLAVEADFEGQLLRLMGGFKEDSPFHKIYAFAFKLTLFRAINKNLSRFKSQEINWIKPFFPLSPSTFQEILEFGIEGGPLVPEDISEIIRASEAY